MSFETKEAVVAELEQYTANERDLYGQQTSIFKSLATKKARGQYKHALAVKAFGYLAEAGAKKYAKEFGGTWHQMFDVPTRRAVAENFTKSFEDEYALGNYDALLPKKYQAKTPAHARKKLNVKWKTPEALKIVWSVPNSAYFALWPARGPVKDQQVLKTASAEDMHNWLRDTYGSAYGIAGRTSSSQSHHATISKRDISEFRGFLRNATDRQVQGIFDKEKGAGRDEYAELAIAEAERRGIDLDGRDDHATITLGVHAHARRKSPAQLDREISHALSRRGGR